LPKHAARGGRFALAIWQLGRPPSRGVRWVVPAGVPSNLPIEDVSDPYAVQARRLALRLGLAAEDAAAARNGSQA